MLTMKEIDRMRYRPTRGAEEFLLELRSMVGIGDKATAARLAIARSVCEPAANIDYAISQLTGIEKGMPIEGVHLLGDDAEIWASVIADTAEDVVEDSSRFRLLTEFHWHRGALLLQRDLKDASNNIIDFIVDLSNKLPHSDGKSPSTISSAETTLRGVSSGAVTRIISIKLLNEHPPWTLNSAGGNGLMVISGRPGSGKSQLALDLLVQASRFGAKFLFFDLKGELQDSRDDSHQRANRTKFFHQTGASYVRLIDTRIPINPLVAGRTDAERAQIASEIANLIRSFASQLGANQERLIREAYEDVALPDISTVVQGLRDRGEDGVALSVFDKIRSFNIFSSADESMPLEDWLSESRVIDFTGLGNDNETKSLVVALILNSIMRQLNRQLQVVDGVQPLQMILFVDEAHLLLPKEGKSGLLGSIARQGRSWGFPVWLASQDADAFITKGQNATDFSKLADCGIHLSPQVLSEPQQRQIFGQVIHRKIGNGDGVLRLKGETHFGKIRQYWRDSGQIE